MRDLTQGSIARQILNMALPIFASMLLQTLYYIVDLYFVSRLGDAAIAGVSTAGNIMFVIFSLTQMLGVGIIALISHAVGRKDAAEANLVFNQSIVLSILCALLTLVLGYGGTDAYMRTLGADSATALAGKAYLYWFLPGLALQFAMVAMGSALRGTGIVKPSMVAQGLSILLNIVLAPVLIAGWGTHHPLGVAGAGLATTISIAFGVFLLTIYFLKLEKYVRPHPSMWAPRFAVWGRILNIGLPAGGEFALMFGYMALIFWIIRDFGAAAQAGFGIGSRVMQSIFLPAIAVAFATAPIVGQNFGARKPERVPSHGAYVGPHDLRGHAGTDADLPVACRGFDSAVLQRAARARVRRAVFDDHLVELRGERSHFYLLERLSGTWQHVALAREQRIAHHHICGSRNLAVGTAVVPDSSSVVSVRDYGKHPGADEPLACPARVESAPDDADSGARSELNPGRSCADGFRTAQWWRSILELIQKADAAARIVVRRRALGGRRAVAQARLQLQMF